MITEPEHLDIERVLAVLRRRWWVIVVFAVLLTAAAFAFSEHQQKQYTASASVLFQDPQLSQQESGLQVTPTSPSEDPTIMATNVQLLTQQSGVAGSTARIVGHGLTSSDVSHAISVSQQGQTSVANVSATSTSPDLAAAIANTFVAQFISSQAAQQRASVQQALNLVERQVAAMSRQQLAGSTGQALVDRAESLRILARLQDGGAQVVTPATVPTAASSPKVKRNSLLGLLLGLFLGLIAAFVLERFDRSIKTVEELEAIYQLPLLAAVPRNRVYATPKASAIQHSELEVFRLLRAYLRYFNVDRELRSLLIASAASGDGKTTVCRNLAQAAAETGTRTLLIEADLRLPGLAEQFDIAPAPGLSEVLSGSADREVAISSTPVATRVNGATTDLCLDVLVAGHPPPNPAELLESQAMADLIVWASEHYSLVVIDTPPLSAVSDAVPLLGQVDGVVVVSELGKNTRDAAALLRERLVALKAPLLGVVANGVKARREMGYGYRNYGEARSGASEPEPRQSGQRQAHVREHSDGELGDATHEADQIGPRSD